ncbi:hypothetical protein [Flavobacterium pedocola]
MEKNYALRAVCVAILLFFQHSYAQVGVGTTNPLSTLHVNGTMRVTNTNNTTTTTKLTGTCTQGIVSDVTIGPNLSLVNNVLSAGDGDNSVYKVAAVKMTTPTSNFVFDNLNLDLSGANDGVVVFRLYGSTQNFSIRGIQGGVDGRHIVLYNSSPVNMKMDHMMSSVPANRIDTIGASTSTSGIGTVDLVYDGANSKWIVLAIRD